MDSVDSVQFLSHGQPWALVAQTAGWAVVVLVCLLRLRRPWTWPGLAGGVLGLVSSAAFLADYLAMRRALDQDAGGGWFAAAGFVSEHDLYTELNWAQGLAPVLLGVSLVVQLVRSRRGADA